MRQCPTCGTKYWGDSERTCVADGAVLQDVIVANDRTRLLGAVIPGQYRLDGLLGDGGMGVVYRGVSLINQQVVAVKVLRAEYSAETDLVARFEAEARAAAMIQHRNIVKVFEFGALEDGSRFFVMEYLDGKSLGQVMHNAGRNADGTKRPLDVKLALHVATQICAGLQAAHDNQIVHRDMKPDNVHLVREGTDAAVVKILDFGIAKVLNSAAAKTRTGSVFGTPQYMSPEQANGESNMDARTDVYAVGILLYEMVCGRLPFDADNLMGILAAHMYQPPIAPRTVPAAKQVTAALEAVILKALAKDRAHRYQSMSEFADDLRRVSDGMDPNAFDDAVPTIVQPGGRASLTPPLAMAAMRPSQAPAAIVAGPQPTFSPVTGPSAKPAQASTNPLVFALAGVGVIGFIAAGYVAITRSRNAHRDDEAVGITVPTNSTVPQTDAPSGPAVPTLSATIRVVTSPEGAQLLAAGQPVCMTPCELPRPTAAPAVYSVEIDGFLRSSFTVEPQSPAAIQLMLPPRARNTTVRQNTGTAPRVSPTNTGTNTTTSTGASNPLRNPWQDPPQH
jgi:serine/threonine-protein kinase